MVITMVITKVTCKSKVARHAIKRINKDKGNRRVIGMSGNTNVYEKSVGRIRLLITMIRIHREYT